MRPEDVFIPDAFPIHTYVPQKGGEFERQLENGLKQMGKIISIIGASKTGKTTLCEKRFQQNRILVPGSRIRKSEDLWVQAYEQAGGTIQPSFHANPIDNAVGHMVSRRLPLVLDDFHYVDREVQKDIARQIKNAAYEGLTVIVLNLPHRSDDPIRANPDLRGRVFSIDCGFWQEDDLRKIGDTGFPLVDAKADDQTLQWLASESMTSPQIMQTLCLEVCRDAKISGKGVAANIALQSLKQPAILKNAAMSYGSQTVLTQLRQGPLRKGQARKKFKFRSGGDGDVYELLVRVIVMDPPLLTFSYEQIRERAMKILPAGSSPNLLLVLNRLGKMYDTSESKPIEWDQDQRKLAILDPHAYFWMRQELAWLRKK